MTLPEVMSGLRAAQGSGRLAQLRADTTVQDQLEALKYDAFEVRPAAVLHATGMRHTNPTAAPPAPPWSGPPAHVSAALRCSVVQIVSAGQAGLQGETYVVNIGTTLYQARLQQLNAVLRDK